VPLFWDATVPFGIVLETISVKAWSPSLTIVPKALGWTASQHLGCRDWVSELLWRLWFGAQPWVSWNSRLETAAAAAAATATATAATTAVAAASAAGVL